MWFLIYSALYPHEHCGLQQLSLDLMHNADSVAIYYYYYYFQTSWFIVVDAFIVILYFKKQRRGSEYYCF